MATRTVIDASQELAKRIDLVEEYDFVRHLFAQSRATIQHEEGACGNAAIVIALSQR
jgi:hypothetical protein